MPALAVSHFNAKQKSKGAFVEIEFGEPSKDCGGLGICRIKFWKKTELHSKCNRAKAYMTTAGMNQDFIILVLDKSSLCAQSKNRFFSSQYFQINEMVFLDESIKSAINTSRTYIPKSSYRIKESDRHITIIC